MKVQFSNSEKPSHGVRPIPVRVDVSQWNRSPGPRHQKHQVLSLAGTRGAVDRDSSTPPLQRLRGSETKRRRRKGVKETREIERQNQRFDLTILRAIWLRRENILKTEVGPNVN